MDEISKFEEFDRPTTPYLSDKEVFTKIWTRPREVFEFILKYGYEKYKILLLFLAGASSSIDNVIEKHSEYSLIMIIGIGLLVGGLIGWIFIYIYAALVSWIGSWMDGKSDTEKIFSVFIYAAIPGIFSLIFIIINHLLSKNFEDDFFFGILIIITSGIYIVLNIWGMILNIIGVACAQKFPWWKALINLLLPAILIGIPIVLIFFAIR